jgi:hypothetical protein
VVRFFGFSQPFFFLAPTTGGGGGLKKRYLLHITYYFFASIICFHHPSHNTQRLYRLHNIKKLLTIIYTAPNKELTSLGKQTIEMTRFLSLILMAVAMAQALAFAPTIISSSSSSISSINANTMMKSQSPLNMMPMDMHININMNINANMDASQFQFLESSSNTVAAATIDPTTALSQVLGGLLGSPIILLVPIGAAITIATVIAWLIVSYANPADPDED